VRAGALLLIPVLLLGGGCASYIPNEGESVLVPADAVAFRRLERWQLVGRVAMRDRQESWTGTLWWFQRSSSSEMRLHGPFGRGGLVVKQRPGQASVKTSDGHTYESYSADELVAEHFQWPVPVASLRYWVTGTQAVGAITEPQRDSAGRLQQFRQHGWLVSYQNYQAIDGVELPMEIELRQGSRSVRVVVRQWKALAVDS